MDDDYVCIDAILEDDEAMEALNRLKELGYTVEEVLLAYREMCNDE